jgi:hypothetical protein
MAQEIQIGNDLYDLLNTRNFDVDITDERGQAADPADGKVFKFDWVSSNGNNYGTAVIVAGDENELMLFYGDNLGKGMAPEDKDEWFGFMKELKDFSTRHNFNTFSPKNINALKHTMTGMAAIKEGLFEGYYGTRKISYMGEQTEARLVIKHNRMIGENDKRYRYVESLFIETVDGERFKLPFVKLVGGRAMLEHVRQGGRPYDIRGQHITETVGEMAVLSRFRRAQQGRMFEGVTQQLVESANQYYEALQSNLKHLATGRGYTHYFESWTPADIGEQESLVEDLRTMFIEQTLDTRIEQALPTLAKIQQRGTAMKEAQIFENWVNGIMEGTWALPDTPEAQEKLNQLMTGELIVGPDATNATELLYDVIGDDQLFDILGNLAAQDPRANIWDDSDVQARLAELGIQTPQSSEVEPADVAQDTAPEQGMAEGDNLATFESINQLRKSAGLPVQESVLTDSTGHTMDHIIKRFTKEVADFKERGDLDDDLYHALYDYYFDDMPYGTKKARDGDPYEWVSDRFYADLGLSEGWKGELAGGTLGGVGGTVAGSALGALATGSPIGAAIGGVVGGAAGGTGGAMLGREMTKEGSCNSTMEGEYCPEHGLMECGMYEMGTVAGGMAPVIGEAPQDAINYNGAVTGSYYESDELARIKTLALLK